MNSGVFAGTVLTDSLLMHFLAPVMVSQRFFRNFLHFLDPTSQVPDLQVGPHTNFWSHTVIAELDHSGK